MLVVLVSFENKVCMHSALSIPQLWDYTRYVVVGIILTSVGYEEALCSAPY